MLTLQDAHRKAIELKYAGHTHQKISELLQGTFTKGTLDQYFREGGLLREHYKKYAEEQALLREEEARNLFKKEVGGAARVILNVLRKAVETENDEKAFLYAKEVLDRAGLVVNRFPDMQLNKNEQNNFYGDINLSQLSDEQLAQFITSKQQNLTRKASLSPVGVGEENQTEPLKIHQTTQEATRSQPLRQSHKSPILGE